MGCAHRNILKTSHFWNRQKWRQWNEEKSTLLFEKTEGVSETETPSNFRHQVILSHNLIFTKLKYGLVCHSLGRGGSHSFSIWCNINKSNSF